MRVQLHRRSILQPALPERPHFLLVPTIKLTADLCTIAPKDSDAKCRALGAEPGTPLYARCRARLDGL
jgi:hypothetical protein